MDIGLNGNERIWSHQSSNSFRVLLNGLDASLVGFGPRDERFKVSIVFPGL